MHNDNQVFFKKDKLLAKRFLNQINQIIDYKIKKISTVESAIIQTINNDGTVNIVFPLDETVFTNIQNQSIYRDLQIGDSVKVFKQNNNTSNMWIIGKHSIRKNETTGLDKATLMADYLIEVGKLGIWSYEKRNSGVAECWCTTKIVFDKTQKATTGIEGLWLTATYIDLPLKFVDVPTVSPSCSWNYTEIVQAQYTEINGWPQIYVRLFCSENGFQNATGGNIPLQNGTTGVGKGLLCSFRVKGNWK